MFSSAKPELCITTHAAVHSMVWHPESWTCLTLLHSLPWHIRGERLSSWWLLPTAHRLWQRTLLHNPELYECSFYQVVNIMIKSRRKRQIRYEACMGKNPTKTLHRKSCGDVQQRKMLSGPLRNMLWPCVQDWSSST